MIIKHKDYKRIFETIYSVIKHDTKDVTKSCIQFSMIGAMMLQHHYKLDAKVCMGLAVYYLDDKSVFCYGEREGDLINLSKKNFHAWIIVNDTWIIDFTSPLFPLKAEKEFASNYPYPPTAFQKHLDSMTTIGDHTNKRGDFYLYFDEDFTRSVAERFAARPFNVDCARICVNWYKKPPFNMKKEFPIFDTKTGIMKLTRDRFRIVGNFE